MAPGGMDAKIPDFEGTPMKIGKWHKVDENMDVVIPDGIFDYMLTWSPESGISIESVNELTDANEIEEIAEFSHFQFIKLPVKV